MPQSILVVDDDELMRQSVTFHLEKAGYHVQTAAAAEPALALAQTQRPDLVLLDVNLPGMDGLAALRHFQNDLNLPVILVTARRREFDEVLGLEMGANDYITKPFDKDVLIARVRSVLRRVAPPAAAAVQNAIQVGDLTLVPNAHTATVAKRKVTLSPREFRLLHTLALEAGNVLSVDDLLQRVWGAEFIGQPQVVYVHIRWLREKIEDDPQRPTRILTVRGIGYKLAAPEDGT